MTLRTRKPKPIPWWWLSFCDTDKPEGERSLGVILTQARSFMEAVHITHRLKINPGGEIAGWNLPLSGPAPDLKFRNKLLTRAEIIEMQGECRTVGEVEALLGKGVIDSMQPPDVAVQQEENR